MNLALETNYTYLKMGVKALIKSPSVKTLGSLLKYFAPWKHHLAKERNSVVDKQPWFSFAAIDYLKTLVHPQMRVFEYGSGGSTLFWAERTGEVISIEHDEQWFQLMKRELERQGVSNVRYYFIPPDNNQEFVGKSPANAADYISAD